MMRAMEGIAIEVHRDRPIAGAALRALFASAGWERPAGEGALEAVLGTGPAVGAWSGDQLVGFARAVTDGRLRAYVEDVAVHERYRRRGVATAVMRRLLDELDEIAIVSLFCDPSLLGLYRGLGFRSTSQVVLHLR